MSRALRWSLRRADALIAVSEFVAGTLVDAGHDPARVHVVHNAIEPTAWVPRRDRAAARRELGVEDDTAVVLTVCRLFPEKGPAELIRACAAARPDIPKLKLIIAGLDVSPGGWFGKQLATLSDELGVAEHVVIAGRRDDIPRLMAAADVFAMPSFGEPFGLVYAEAMAMELPVVALDHGGTREVVDNGTAGLLSDPGDLDALTANLTKLLQDPALRSEMGRAGRIAVFERFTTERMAGDVAAVYRFVLRPGRKGIR